jgi:protein tyrosine/serine phosphatase
LLAVAGSMTGCASAPRATGNVVLSAPVRPLDDPVLPNFGVVRPGELYRGGQPRMSRKDHNPDGFELLDEKYNVRTIVDLTNEPIDRWLMGRKADCAEMTRVQRKHLRYVQIPSVEWYPSREHLIKFLRIFQNPENRPVFVHCSAGENRSGALVAGFRVIEDSWQPADAKKEMRNFSVLPIWTLVNDRFVDTLAQDRDAIRLELGFPDEKQAIFVECTEHEAGMPSTR